MSIRNLRGDLPAPVADQVAVIDLGGRRYHLQTLPLQPDGRRRPRVAIAVEEGQVRSIRPLGSGRVTFEPLPPRDHRYVLTEYAIPVPFRVRDVVNLFRAEVGVNLDDVLDYLTDIGGIDLERLVEAYVAVTLAAGENSRATVVDPPSEER